MNTLAIRGIPRDVPDYELDDALLKLFRAIGSQIESDDLVDVRRVAGIVLCKLPERRHLYHVFSCARKLKNLRAYRGVIIAQSLCREYSKISQLIRLASKERRIAGTRIHNGKNQMMLHGSDRWVNVTHMEDLYHHRVLQRESSNFDEFDT